MILLINSAGKLVFENISAEEQAYIDAYRSRETYYTKYRTQHGEYAGKLSENYQGTVYVLATPYEEKSAVVELLDELIRRFCVTVTPAAKSVLEAWRIQAGQSEGVAKLNEEIALLKQKEERFRKIMKEGCRACPHFRIGQSNGDMVGRCTVCGDKELPATAYLPGYGRTVGARNWGMKFYPCKGCEYLEEKEKEDEHLREHCGCAG